MPFNLMSDDNKTIIFQSKYSRSFTRDELVAMNKLSLEEKIKITNDIVDEFYTVTNGLMYVSFSGGKDSTVMADIILKRYPDTPLVFCNTGLEYPEIVEFVKRRQNVVLLKPTKPFHKVLEEYGYPVISKEQSRYIEDVQNKRNNWERRLTGNSFAISKKWRYLIDAPFKISEKCCYYLKKTPMKKYEHETKRQPLIGVMFNDSNLRLKYMLEQGLIRINTRKQCTPLGFWSEQDILEYIATYNLDYASVYGELTKENGIYKLSGVQHTGCMFCMYGIHLEKGENKFQRMKKTHFKQWEFCIHKLGLGKILDYIGVDYGKDKFW